MTESEVAKPHRFQRGQLVNDTGNIAKKSDCIPNSHLQHIGDGFTVEKDLQGLPVVASTAATGTGRVSICHEQHVEFDHAIALATLATTAADVERKPAGFVTTHFGQRNLGKQVSQQIEQADKGRRIGAWAASNRLLVHLHESFK